MTAEERLEKAEERLQKLENLVGFVMSLAAKHPLGRKILSQLQEKERV